MLKHSQQQDEARMAAVAAATQQQLFSALHAQQQQHGQQSQLPNDLTMKMQQAQLQKQQMDMLGKLMGAGTNAAAAAAQMRGSPLLDMGAQQSRELLSRPEAQAILQGG